MSEAGRDYWSVIQPFWDDFELDPTEAFVARYAALPAVAKHLMCTHWCQSEVNNGGFPQFFLNSTGVLAPEAVVGFREIGLPEVAAVVQSAVDKLGDPYPRDRELRAGEMVFLIMPGVYEVAEGETEEPTLTLEPEDEWPRWRQIFDPLDDEFYSLIDAAGGFESVADAYARRMSGTV